MAARGEGSVDVGGGGGGGGGRVSSSTEPIQTRNLSYQFLLGGVAKSSPVRLDVRYINAIQKFCRPRRGRARVSTASRGSHRHHRRPTTPTIISLSLSLSRQRFSSSSCSSVPGLRGRIHFRQSFCVLPFIASSIFSAG